MWRELLNGLAHHRRRAFPLFRRRRRRCGRGSRWRRGGSRRENGGHALNEPLVWLRPRQLARALGGGGQRGCHGGVSLRRGARVQLLQQRAVVLCCHRCAARLLREHRLAKLVGRSVRQVQAERRCLAHEARAIGERRGIARQRRHVLGRQLRAQRRGQAKLRGVPRALATAAAWRRPKPLLAWVGRRRSV